MNQRHPRRIKLIKTGLQFRLIGAFGAVVVLALFCQFLLLSFFLGRAAAGIEGVGGELAEAIPGVALVVLGLSLLVILPPFIALGVLLTHRIAGPVYRFEQHLKSIEMGEDIGPCRLRKGDELKPLCESINRAVDAMRARAAGAETADDDQDLSEAA